MSIGSVICRLRQEAGLSRAELAEKCNLDRSAIFRIEEGTRQPTESTVLLIAQALEVDVAVLYNSVVISLDEYNALQE